MLRWLQPSPTLTQQDTQRSLRLMRWDGVLASAMAGAGGPNWTSAWRAAAASWRYY